MLFGNIRLFRHSSPRASVCAFLFRHPDFCSVSKASAHLIPEVRLILGIINSFGTRWLSKKVDLIRFILLCFLLWELLKVLIKCLLVIVADANSSLYVDLSEVGHVSKLLSLMPLFLKFAIDLGLQSCHIFLATFEMISKEVSEPGFLGDSSHVVGGVGERFFAIQLLKLRLLRRIHVWVLILRNIRLSDAISLEAHLPWPRMLVHNKLCLLRNQRWKLVTQICCKRIAHEILITRTIEVLLLEVAVKNTKLPPIFDQRSFRRDFFDWVSQLWIAACIFCIVKPTVWLAQRAGVAWDYRASSISYGWQAPTSFHCSIWRLLWAQILDERPSRWFAHSGRIE